MSNALILKSEWTPEQMKLITDTVARGASQNELELFLYRCKNMGLDPLKPGQIHFVKYGNGPGTVVVGIEGFRSIAGRTGKLNGIKRGVIRDDKGKLIGGWAEVFRKDWTECAREEAPLVEYNTGKGPWAKMPETMIKKVAEAAALRMAFPDDLGGVYESAEMDQAENRRVIPEQPATEDGIQDLELDYRIPGGTYQKRGFHELDSQEVLEYISRREEAIQSGKIKKPVWWDEFVERAEEFYGAVENTTDQV